MIPRQIAAELDLPTRVQAPSWVQLADAAAVAYWRRRPHVGVRCGSIFGYRDHEQTRTVTCEPCRKAMAMVKAIRRLRAARGLDAQGRPLRLDRAA